MFVPKMILTPTGIQELAKRGQHFQKAMHHIFLKLRVALAEVICQVAASLVAPVHIHYSDHAARV